jgi:hypothetical protein
MGYNFTNSLTVDGSSGTKNLLSLMTALGYQGPTVISEPGTLLNISATVPCYAFFTDRNDAAPGVKQVETATVVGTITGAGTLALVLTAAGMTGTPITLNPTVTVGMTAAQVAAAINNALSSDARIRAFLDIVTDPALATVVLTRKSAAANDGTLNLSIDNGTCTGLTTAASSANTTNGSLYTTQGFPFENAAGFSANLPLPKGTDLSTTWLYTASSIPIVAEITN